MFPKMHSDLKWKRLNKLWAWMWFSNTGFASCYLALSLCCASHHPGIEGTERKAVGSKGSDRVTFPFFLSRKEMIRTFPCCKKEARMLKNQIQWSQGNKSLKKKFLCHCGQHFCCFSNLYPGVLSFSVLVPLHIFMTSCEQETWGQDTKMFLLILFLLLGCEV